MIERGVKTPRPGGDPPFPSVTTFHVYIEGKALHLFLPIYNNMLTGASFFKLWKLFNKLYHQEHPVC